MATCLIGIGSNLGEPDKNLDEATAHLKKWSRATRLDASEWLQTAPIGGPEGQSTFANGALRLETDCSPREVLEKLLETEQSLGRERRTRWGPRTVDLDLLLYDDLSVLEEGLTIPHPWMAIRRFVLQPAVQVAADMVHPEIGWTIERLWENLQTAQYVAIAGVTPGPVREAVVAAVNDAGATLVPASVGTPFGEALKSVTSGAAKSVENFFVSEQWYEDPVSENPRPNLVIALENEDIDWTDSQKRERESLFNRVRKSGPFLFLNAADIERLQHDLSAAISGMRSAK